jgi:hypothetical protein
MHSHTIQLIIYNITGVNQMDLIIILLAGLILAEIHNISASANPILYMPYYWVKPTVNKKSNTWLPGHPLTYWLDPITGWAYNSIFGVQPTLPDAIICENVFLLSLRI